MKTKFLKIGMPIMVFMLAIVFAFATEKTVPENEPRVITGYIMLEGVCISSEKNCNDESNIACTDEDLFGEQVYLQRLGESFCSQELFHSEPQ